MNKHRVNIPMCLASILLCLTLFSFRLMGGLDAKYSTSASGSDSARVITFGDVTITESGDFTASDTSAPILPGVNMTKNVTVSFEGSEAATFVFVEIVTDGWETTDNRTFKAEGTFAQNHDITWSIVPITNNDDNPLNDWTFLKSTHDSETNRTSYVYYMAVAPNAKLENVPVIANGGVITVPEITRTEYRTLGALTITVSATVVQANGFASAADAWASVSN